MSGEWRWRAGRQAFRKDPTSIPASRRIARSVPFASDARSHDCRGLDGRTESRKYEGGARLRGKKIQLSVPSGDGDRDTEFPDGATLVAEHRRERVSVLAAGFHDFTSNTLRDLDGFGDAPAFGYESGYVRASG